MILTTNPMTKKVAGWVEVALILALMLPTTKTVALILALMLSKTKQVAGWVEVRPT